MVVDELVLKTAKNLPETYQRPSRAMLILKLGFIVAIISRFEQ